MTSLDVLVMGGTRFMGRATVEALIARGHRVVVFNRGTNPDVLPPDVEQVHGDRDDETALAQLSGRDLDAVVDFSAYFGRQTAMVLEALPEVPRFVHCSTGAVYQPQGVLPWPETAPRGPWALWGSYAREKLAGEQELAARRTSGTTVVLRLPFVLGPRNYAPREEFVLNRVLDDAEVLLPGDGEAVVQMVSVDQVAYTASLTMEAALDGWQEFNLACDWFVSLRGIVEAAAEVLDRPARIRAVGGGASGTGADAFNPMDCVFPFPNANYVLDVRRLSQAGLQPPERSLQGMLERALQALENDPTRREWKRTPAERQAAAPA